jgi:hypothetical protein
VAWHAGYYTSKDFAHLARSDRAELVQPVDRTIWNAGGCKQCCDDCKKGCCNKGHTDQCCCGGFPDGCCDDDEGESDDKNAC